MTADTSASAHARGDDGGRVNRGGSCAGRLGGRHARQDFDPRSEAVARAYDYDVAVVGASIAGCTWRPCSARRERGSRCWSAAPTRLLQDAVHALHPAERHADARAPRARRADRGRRRRPQRLEVWSRYGWVRPDLGADYAAPQVRLRHPPREAGPDAARARRGDARRGPHARAGGRRPAGHAGRPAACGWATASAPSARSRRAWSSPPTGATRTSRAWPASGRA